MLDTSADHSARWLASVQLKNTVARHWRPGRQQHDARWGAVLNLGKCTQLVQGASLLRRLWIRGASSWSAVSDHAGGIVCAGLGAVLMNAQAMLTVPFGKSTIPRNESRSRQVIQPKHAT
jgi:hypothetical protein